MIGETLRKERENQKLSVQDIEKGTSIRAIYIEAIEQGEYDKLPGEVYAKGFIKNYANFLNLDGDDFVKKFIMEISPTIILPEENQAAAEPQKVTEDKPAPADAGIKNRVQKSREADEDADSEPNSDSRKLIFAAAALLLLLIGGLVYGLSGSDEENEIVQKQEETQPQTAPEPQQVAQVTPQPVPETPPVPQPPTSDVNLQATFSDDCWTQVVSDGAVVYEGMINAGQNFNWEGKQSIYVVLGNAGAAQFIMNGQNIGALGAAGEVVDRIFTR